MTCEFWIETGDVTRLQPLVYTSVSHKVLHQRHQRMLDLRLQRNHSYTCWNPRIEVISRDCINVVKRLDFVS